MNAPLHTAASLRAAGRMPPFPFQIDLDDGTQLDAIRLLRVLPEKRVVGEGVRNGQHVLFKLFIASASERHWAREQAGLQLLRDAALPTPALLGAGRLTEGGHYLLTEFLGAAQPLAAEAENHHLLPAMRLIGNLHAQGLIQSDGHFSNILRQNETLYLIDGDGIRTAPPRGIQRNLALFLAQLPIRQMAQLDRLLNAWRETAPTQDIDPDVLAQDIRRERQKRLDDYLNKSLRDCTQFKVVQDFRRFTAVVRGEAERLAPILADPDAWMARGTPLKTGNTSTVVRLDLDSGPIVIKRYNIKGPLHALSRFWRPSRAWHAWREGHRLSLLGIATPAPLALIERRLGPMRSKAWLITACSTGHDLLTESAAYMETGLPASLQASLVELIKDLAEAKISHGDMKATNLLLEAGQLTLIDLDAMQQHTSHVSFCRAQGRDIARLHANWPRDSVLYKALQTTCKAN